MDCLAAASFDLTYEVRLSIFCVLASLVGVFFLVLFLKDTIKRFLYKHFTMRMYYKTIKKVVLYNDFFLINDFVNMTAGSEVFHIDHIMVGNKFIYCIRDRYYPGAIAAKEEDPNWIFYSGKKAIYIQNPMLINKIRVERLSMMTGFDSRFLVSIVLINDDCMMTPIENTYSDNFLVSLKNLPSFISYMESQNVDPLDPHAAAVAVHDLSELNLRGKLKNE